MARPGLDKNVKFRQLIRALGLPRPYVRGLLETMWDVAHESGNPVLGCEDSVEAAAEWPGARGDLFNALKSARLIDPMEDGRWIIHDYWDHAPDYVEGRAKKEAERAKPKACANCGKAFRSGEPHAKFCSDACRQANHRNAASRGVTEPCVTVTESNAAPSPSPSPSPVLSLQERTKESVREPKIDAPGFDAFWSAYPRKTAKKRAAKAWRQLAPNSQLLDRMLAALAAQKAWDQWVRGIIPHPATWLNERRWEDERPPSQVSGRPDLGLIQADARRREREENMRRLQEQRAEEVLSGEEVRRRLRKE